MQTLLKTKIGPFLVISSVLAVWTFLVVQPVQAHTLTNPSCSSLPKAEFFMDQDRNAVSVAALSSSTPEVVSTTTKKGTGDTGEGNKNYYYAKITVPALTAGELDVSDAGDGPSEAILCGRQEGNVSSLPSYASAHARAESDAAAADKAAENADDDAAKTNPSVSTLKGDLRTAANALEEAADDLEDIAAALRKIGTSAANDAADLAADYDGDGNLDGGAANDANTDAGTADSNANTATTVSDLRAYLETAADDLETAADALETAATSLDGHTVLTLTP